jgi:hypothetical protein
MDFDSEEAVITRILCLEEFDELARALIHTERRLNIAAIEALAAGQKRQLGIRTINGADQPFISFAETDVEKLVKAILADAQKRQGDNSDAGGKKKGKAKIKEVA